MTGVELADNRLVFEDILEAVQESKRGRWFLQEFETRIQKRDTASILNAITRLESRMQSPENQNANPEELARVRAAISGARSDLLKMGIGRQAMSEEGRLFASLAELAKTTLPSNDTNPGIVRSLQLVDEIDKVISPAPRGSKLFAADAHLFETARAPQPAVLAPPAALVPTAAPAPTESAAPAIVTVAPSPTKKDDAPQQTGAKLVIRKLNQNQAAVEAPQAEEQALPEPPQSPEPQAEAPPQTEHPRIIITRRKPSDMTDVTIEGVEETSSAA